MKPVGTEGFNVTENVRGCLRFEIDYVKDVHHNRQIIHRHS